MTVFFFASGCASDWFKKIGLTEPLSATEKAVRQIYSEESNCKKLGEITEENGWDGSYVDVKNRLKRTTAIKGGNAYMIDKVIGQRKVTTAYIYFCT